MGTSVWAESVGMIIEFGLHYGFKYLLDTLLYQTVFHCGNAKRPHFSVRFGYFYPPYLVRKVILQALTNICYVILYSGRLPIDNGFPVYPCCFTAFVGFNASICQQDVPFVSNDIVQVPEDRALLAICIQFVKDIL